MNYRGYMRVVMHVLSVIRNSVHNRTMVWDQLFYFVSCSFSCIDITDDLIVQWKWGEAVSIHNVMTSDYLLCLLQILYCGSLASNDCSLDLGMFTVKYTSEETVSKSVSEPQISWYRWDVATKWHAIKDLLGRFHTFDFSFIAFTAYYSSTIYFYDIGQKDEKMFN